VGDLGGGGRRGGGLGLSVESPKTSKINFKKITKKVKQENKAFVI